MDFRDSINAIGKIRCIMITPLFLCLKYYRVNLFIICVGDFPAIRIMPGHILNKKASCTIFQGFLSRWTLKRFWVLCNVFQRLLNNSLDFRTYKVSKVIDNIDKVMGQIRLDILHRSIHDSLTAFFRSP